MNLKTWTMAFLLAGGMGLASLGCDFVFSYKSITAPLGTWGEVGIRVYKTHRICTLPDPYAYDLPASGVQILKETPWQEIQPGVLEKWVVISLAEVGDGYLKISKTCTKEGYEEGVLPIRVVAPTPEGAWSQAWEGTYPFELPPGYTWSAVFGEASVHDGVLSLEGMDFTLPSLPSSLREQSILLRVFYVVQEGKPFPILIVGEGIFWRYDHLLQAS